MFAPIRHVLCLSMCAGLAQAQTYRIRPIDLDPGIGSSAALDLTDDGRVAGWQSVEGGRRTFGFIWRDGAIEQLVVPQAGDFSVSPRLLDIHHHAQVHAITESGHYAGVGGNVNFGFSSQPYFSWIPSPDPYPGFHPAADDIGIAQVHGIADTGGMVTVVGSGAVSVGSVFVRRGYISRVSQADDVGDPARMTFIVNPIAATFNTAALDVNSAGVVVGFGEDAQRLRRAFRRDPISGVITTLPIFGGASEALDISDAGYVVGFGAVSPGSTMGFIIGPGSDVAALTGTLGGASSAAYGVNNLGHAVGESWTAAGDVRAFVVDDRGIVDLNTLIPPDSGWHLTHAEAINDAGMIVGWGMFEGRQLAFVLEPVGCTADLTGASDPSDPTYGLPDGSLDINDFFYYLDQFVSFNLAVADLSGSSDPNDPSYGSPDGTLDVSDFFYYLDLFVQGCS
jgi:probable HAF family extracellular repeat protein